MLKLKYIRTSDDDFIIFTSGLTHVEMQRCIEKEIKSAGFAYFSDVQMGGESLSLRISSLPEDAEKVERLTSLY